MLHIYVNIYVIHLSVSNLSNSMLIYVKILKPFDHLAILSADD